MQPAWFTGTRIVRLALVIAVAGTYARPARAQDEPKGLTASGHLVMMIPHGDFNKEFNTLGFGLAFDLGYSFPLYPVTAGLGGFWASYGSQTFHTSFTDGIRTFNAEASSENTILVAHLFIRLQPQRGFFKPYFEGSAGLSFFTTWSTFTDLSTDREIGGETESLTVAFSYGASAGIMVRVWKGTPDEHSTQTLELFADVRMRYIGGSTAKYYLPDAMYLDTVSSEIRFDPSKRKSSTTDMIVPYLGVSVLVP